MPDPTTLAALATISTGAMHAASHPAGDTRPLCVLVEDAAHVDRLSAALALGPGDVVFAPQRPALGSTRATVHTYRGRLAQACDRFEVNPDFVLEVQAYAVSRFLLVGGPTLVRITGAEDLDALVADAALAQQSGVFPPVHTSPAVQLADLPAFGHHPGAGPADGPDGPAQGDAPGVPGGGPGTRLYVRADGTVSVSAAGATLARVSDPALSRTGLAGAWLELAGSPDAGPNSGPISCPVAVAHAVADERRRAVLADTLWLPRYLAAVGAIRALRSRGLLVDAVSGFGVRMSPWLPLEDGRAPSTRPVLLWGRDGAFVVDPTSSRCVPLDQTRAVALELHLDGPPATPGDPAAYLGAQVAAALGRRGFPHTSRRREVAA